MVFYNAVAVMDKIGGWEKKKEDEHPIAARFGACMLIYTKAVLSARPEDMNNFTRTLHSITDAISKTWEVLYGAHWWFQQDSMELHESEIFRSWQYDIEVPCIMHWGLLWHLLHLNDVLIKIDALRKCDDKTIIKAMETVCTILWEKTHALDSLVGNADGDDDAIHARVGVAS